VTKTTTRVLAGVAVAALAAAGVAAVIRHRQGQKPDPEERAQLDELEARLHEVEEPDKNIPPTLVGRVVENLQRNHGISVPRLRQWITGLRHGTLSPEQATVAESDFDALEREADQRGV
jgi:type II secretory pathway component PulM